MSQQLINPPCLEKQAKISGHPEMPNKTYECIYEYERLVFGFFFFFNLIILLGCVLAIGCSNVDFVLLVVQKY